MLRSAGRHSVVFPLFSANTHVSVLKSQCSFKFNDVGSHNEAGRHQVQLFAPHRRDRAVSAGGTMCAVHVYRVCMLIRRCLCEKGQKQAPLYLAEIYLAFDFLTGLPCG